MISVKDLRVQFLLSGATMILRNPYLEVWRPINLGALFEPTTPFRRALTSLLLAVSRRIVSHAPNLAHIRILSYRPVDFRRYCYPRCPVISRGVSSHRPLKSGIVSVGLECELVGCILTVSGIGRVS